MLRLADQPVQKSSLRNLELLREPEVSPEVELKWSDIAKEDGWKEDRELWRNVDFRGDSSDDEYDHESEASTRSENTSLSSVETRYRKRPTDYLDRPQVQFDLREIRTSQAWRTRTPGKTPTQKITITQMQCIREILFILSGLENSIFDSHWRPDLGIQLSHSSWQIFRALLDSTSNARQSLSILRTYVKQRQRIPLLQAFQAAIVSRLSFFDGIIAKLQAQYASTSQDFVASVMRLLADLDPHMRPLEALAETVGRLQPSKNFCPFHCLELLYDTAQSIQLCGDESVYRFIGQLFFDCFAVYLQPMRCWMEEGELENNDETFFISRSPANIPRSRIWTDQFELKRTPEGSLFAPRFLQPAASKIFTTGKSIVILKLLGKHWPSQERTSESAIRVDMSTVSPLLPFSEIFEQIFDQWMERKHHAASVTLRQTLFQTYNLWSDLAVLQHIYLMSDGSRSAHFATAVFNNIDIFNVNWHNRFNLTEIAREAFDGLAEPHRLSVTISSRNLNSDVKTIRRTVREGLPSICITYRLPWLTRIVLTDECLEQYQRTFTLLLQLRRANQVLTQHRINSGGIASTIEKELFYGLRSKLLWFCNTLQSYLSTLVLGPLVAQLSEEIRNAEDIDQMLTLHSVFTKRILEEACLGGKLDPIREAILDIFDLAVRLRHARQVELWRVAGKAHESDRPLVVSSPQKDSRKRYVDASEEEDNTFMVEQDKGAMMQDAEPPYRRVLDEIQSDLDRNLKFICGGLRGVSRASSSDAASKWDILAEMLESGIQLHQ